MIKCIECVWLDLWELKLERELDNVTTVSLIENLLPENIKQG